ncbi:C6 zinc finger domain containing protein [Neofusicoccum parvum]|uniref:C6 zinc finger domain containing protein n=1 Tax=Neofusicoccum parvum TaxID=310453 RepID=A0ACB5SDR1_9PEZI|nr:C6 zinc finger domain containing protein [Neofusicoccum parvum]
MPTKLSRRKLAEAWDACTTCRNRSVKCDKQKPECQRSLVFSNYNKAIQCLYQQNSGCPQSALVYLSTCLLFTCLEFLQGDTKAAMAHVVCGLNILHTFQKAFDEPLSSQHQPETQTILDDLVPIFCRLSIFANLIGEPTPTVHAKSAELEEQAPIRSISDARARLVDILNDAIRFVWSITPRKYVGGITTTEIIQQVRLELRLAKWWRQFAEFQAHIRQSAAAPTLPAIEAALTILHMHFQMGQIFTAVLTSSRERDWDAHFAQFEQINGLARALVAGRGDGPGAAFSFETEVASPLYLAAVKCRHPRIRREAVALLERSARREGVIDSRRAGRVARAIIKIEEAGLGGAERVGLASDGVPSGRLDALAEGSRNSLPPEENRIQYFYEPDGPVGGVASGPYSLAYKTCRGMYQKVNLEEEGAGEAVATEGHGSASEDESSTYKSFNIAATTYSQRL